MRLFAGKIPISTLLSPSAVMTAVMGIGLLSLLIPKDWYEGVLREHDFMYLNLSLALYVALCVLVFCLGAWFTQYLVRRLVRVAHYTRSSRLHDQFSSNILLILACLLNIYVIGYLQQKIGLSVIISSLGVATEDTRHLISEKLGLANLSWVPTFTSAIIIWGIWSLPPRVRWRNWLWLGVPAVLLLANVLLTLTRTTLIDMVLPISAIVLRRRFALSQISVAWLGRTVMFALTIVLVFLSVLTFARGQASSGNSTLRSLLGYGPASFNRLAAVYEGKLHYPNEGSTYYAIQGVWDMPIFGKQFIAAGKEKHRDLPKNNYDNWRAQFLFVEQSGLQLEYIWATMPGHVLADIGPGWAVIWHFIVGMVAGFAYGLFLKGRSFGLVFYPFLFSGILQSWSIPRMVQSTIWFFLLGAICVFLLRRIPRIVMRRRENTPSARTLGT